MPTKHKKKSPSSKPPWIKLPLEIRQKVLHHVLCASLYGKQNILKFRAGFKRLLRTFPKNQLASPVKLLYQKTQFDVEICKIVTKEQCDQAFADFQAAQRATTRREIMEGFETGRALSQTHNIHRDLKQVARDRDEEVQYCLRCVESDEIYQVEGGSRLAKDDWSQNRAEDWVQD